MRRLCRSHIGSNRDNHSDVSGERRRAGADEESDCRQHAELIGYSSCAPQEDKQHGSHHTNRLVLTVHVGARSLLNRFRNFLHLRVAGIQLEHPHGEIQAIGNTGHRRNQSKGHNR